MVMEWSNATFAVVRPCGGVLQRSDGQGTRETQSLAIVHKDWFAFLIVQ